MNKIKNQRGVILAEFAVAVPLLILLLYSLGSVSLSALKLSNEQVADYVLETEAQEIIDRITTDARAAHFVEIIKTSDQKNFEKVIFICNTNKVEAKEQDFFNTYSQRMYNVDNATGKPFHVYFNRKNNSNDRDNRKNPLSGDNFYGDTAVQELSFDKDFLSKKILHVTIELQSMVTNRRVKFSTAVFMPSCEKIIYRGQTIYPEEIANAE